MKSPVYFLLVLLLSSCAIGFKKLSDKKLEKQEKRGKVELVMFDRLPKPVADTLRKQYEKYRIENSGKHKTVYDLPAFITFDPYLQGYTVKYQDFNSEKFRLPFGYFFRFGKNKFFIPYAEHQLQYPFVYYDGYMFISGKYFGEIKPQVHDVNSPDYNRVDYQNHGYWKIKIKKPRK